MSTATRPGGQVGAGLDHLGLLYTTAREYLDAIYRFVRSALAAGYPVLVAVPGRHLDLVRDGLGGTAARVTFTDLADAGRNPGRILPAVLWEFAARHPGQRVAMVGEPVWAERSEAEYPACVLHEALVNAVMEDHDATVLCPYDAARLPGAAVADAHRTHPVLVDSAGDRTASAAYTDPLATAARVGNRPLPAPPADAQVLPYHHSDQLHAIRERVSGYAAAAGLSDDRVGDLTIAVNELVSNTLEHTAGGGTLRMWSDNGSVICQVDDHGHIADPLAGRIPPPPQALRGRGLVMVNQLCDLVRIHTRPGGTVIRVYMHHAGRQVAAAREVGCSR